MACYHPIPAWRKASGDVVFVERGDVVSSLSLACGRCIGCRLERARQWSVRVMHEASCWDENCFITLTYDQEHCPSDRSLRYGDFQRFMKRLRKLYRGRTVRFFACGEYGTEFDRPHFHAALFNVDFRSDRYGWRKSESGFRVDRSPALERLWPFGSSEIGELSVQSAAYIARYALKKVTGDLADEHYKAVDVCTGEVTWRAPECVHMSLKPGIGGDWFKKFQGDVYPHDRVVMKGKESKPPRFYDKLLKRVDPGLLEDLQMSRVVEARKRWPDNTDERLKVREAVQNARLYFFRRKVR